MINIVSGMKFVVDNLGINYSNVFTAFSFTSGLIPSTNILKSDSWAINASSGILNKTGTFYNYPGTGFFDGSTFIQLNKNYQLNNSIILLSYEKLRHGNEILLSSVTGNAFNNYSGFYVGVNDANKLYLKYWNQVEGFFTFTYSKTLSDKNLIIINRNNNIITLGAFNNNSFKFDTEEFFIFQNNFINNNNLYIGGSPNVFNWGDKDLLNFSGYIDRFYIFNDTSFIYANNLAQGLYSEPDGFFGEFIETCFTSGFLSGSGFSYTGITGVFNSGFRSGVVSITGYKNILSGYSYIGVTGYSTTIIGSYIDNCGVSIDIFETTPLSGLIYNEIPITVALTGITFVSGSISINLTGTITGVENVYITDIICNTGFNITSDIIYKYDEAYLSSLSYKEISLLSTINSNTIEPKNNDIIEIYTEKYQPKTLEYNKNLTYDSLNENYFYIDREFAQNEVLMFANGQALIDSGYELIPQGYDIIRQPILDYFITGTTIETNRFFVNEDNLFYDYLSGKFIVNTGNVFTIPNNINNYFLFKNGQKLVENKDYTLNLSGSNYFLQSILDGPLAVGWGEKIVSNVDSSILVVTASEIFNRGAGYIYTKNSENEFVFKQKIIGGSNGSSMGRSVDITDDGSIIILGAPGDDNAAGTDAGAVFIYTGNTQNNWVLKQKITGENAFDYFGNSVSINKEGTVFIVGAVGDSQNSAGAGASFVFTGNSQDGWALKQKLSGRLLGAFGWSVHINDSGNILMMGGPNDRLGSVLLAGAVCAYTGNSQNGWSLKQIITGLQSNSQFGYDIDANSDSSVLLISCQESNPSFVYTGNAIDGWSLKSTLSSPSNDTTFGNRVGVNKDGSVLFLSSTREDIPNSIDAGAGFVYTGNPQNGWGLKQRLFVEDSSTDKFGQDVTMNRDGSILMMSSLDYIGNNNDGAVAIYTLEKQVELTDNNQNYYIIKEIPDNFIYYSGNSGSLKLNGAFNHGCSQVYYNGIKQKINNNYIENAVFDLISGNINELDFPIQLIYNNTDDFFV